MNDQDKVSEEMAQPAIDDGASPGARRGGGKRLRDNTKAIVVGSLLVGGVAGATILGPLSDLVARATDVLLLRRDRHSDRTG